MNFQEAVQSYAEQPLTRQILLDMLRDYKSPNDKIDELVKQHMLTQIKRGLYIPGPRLNIASAEPFLIANHLYGPSYVSLDTALSYWGLIPERVFEISSISTLRSKLFNTPAGRFSYRYMPLPYYSFGIKQVALTKKQTVLMASAEKALCDKIVTTSGISLRSTKQTSALLKEDFRIDEKLLLTLNVESITGWIENAPKKNSLRMLLKTLKSL
ncbi:MAG: hypothetical protein ABI151_14470 [Chitinophagaceae bacterium]